MPLPNLNTLRMFEAAARHLNFRLAAEELHLTQGAVAQRVRQLEADLGHQLFRRHARGLTLTDAGRSYHPPVRQALALIDEATRALAPAATRVTLSVPPSFAAKWLVPRLPDFETAHPQTELRIVAEESLTDFGRDGSDIAVRLGPEPKERHLQSRLLAPLDLVAAASPATAQAYGSVAGLHDLAQAPLIQDGHRYWEQLLRTAGVKPSGRMQQFNQTALAMDAAANGSGIALVPRLFLDGSPLVEIWQPPAQDGTGFHVVWPRASRGDKRRNAVREQVIAWLLGQG